MKVFTVLPILLLTTLFAIVNAESQAGQSDLGATTVAVPWHDFKEILDRIRPDTLSDTSRHTPPVDYVISSASFTGKKYGAREFRFSADLNVSVLAAKRWVRVDLGQMPSLLPGCTAGAKPGTIGRDENDACFLVVGGPAAYVVHYEFTALLDQQSGRSSLSFGLPGQTAASVALALDLGTYAVTANGIPLSPSKAAGGAWVYSGGLGSGTSVTIAWQQTVTDVSVKNAMVLAQVNTLYGIGTGRLQIHSQVILNVHHRDIQAFSLIVPPTVDIIDLSGPAVAAWETNDSAGVRVLRAYLKYSLHDGSQFELDAEMTFPDSAARLTLPAVTVLNATRQEGTIAVGVLDNVELTPLDNSANVLRRDQRELPPWFADKGDVLYVYQYLSGAYGVDLGLKPHGNVAVLGALAREMRIQSVMRDDGTMITELHLQVRNRGEQFLRLRWKTEWQLWSLYCNGQPARPALDTTTSELLVPLQKSSERTAETDVRLVYLSRERAYHLLGFQAIEYPSTNLPVQGIAGTVYVPDNVRASFRHGTLHHQDESPSTPWFAFLPAGTVARRAAMNAVQAPELSGSEVFGLKKKGALTAARGGAMHAKTIENMPPPAPAAEPAEKQREEEMLDKRELVPKPESVDRAAGTVFGAGGAVDELTAGLAQGIPQQGVSYSHKDLDAGVLSIAVAVDFQGRAEPFRSSMLKAGDRPRFAFLYREVPGKLRLWLAAIIYALVLASGISLAMTLWRRWPLRRAAWGFAAPFLAALLLARVVDHTLRLEIVALPTVLLYVYMAGLTATRWSTAHTRMAGAAAAGLAGAFAQAIRARRKKTPGSKAGSSATPSAPQPPEGRQQ